MVTGGTEEPENILPVRRAPHEERKADGEHFAAPLGASKSGRLRFTNGAHRVVIRADSDLRGLYRARFWGRTPAIWVREGAVTIRCPRSPARDWTGRQERPAEVDLNACIPWDVEVSGSASWLVADLRGLPLRALTLEGGAGRLEVALPVPEHTVRVGIFGGANNVVVRLPGGVAARLRVSGGVTQLGFGSRRIHASGGDVDLRDRGYDAASDRYDVVVTGGANNLILDRIGTRDVVDRGHGSITGPEDERSEL